jgi:hypothetical protein
MGGEMKLIDTTNTPLSEETFSDSENSYSTFEIIKISKKYKPFKLPLKHIDTDVIRWKGDNTINNFAWHMKRCLKAELKYPIIMDNRGTIVNGWHRIIKSIVQNKEYIMCIRLEENLPFPLNK